MNSTRDKIERQIEIMIGERVVLRRVEHFEQRGRRVAAKIRADLVEFVQQNHRIAAFDAAQGLDDASGHRADVGAAMTANFRLVPHAAERDARKLAAERVGHAFAERRFADAGRADEAENRAFDLLAAFDDGEKFQQPVLDFRQAEMLLVQNLFAPPSDPVCPRWLFPTAARGSNRGNCGRRRIRRRRATFAQPFQFLFGGFADFGGQDGLRRSFRGAI